MPITVAFFNCPHCVDSFAFDFEKLRRDKSKVACTNFERNDGIRHEARNGSGTFALRRQEGWRVDLRYNSSGKRVDTLETFTQFDSSSLVRRDIQELPDAQTILVLALRRAHIV